MTLTRRHTGEGEEEDNNDRRDHSYTPSRFGTITLGTKVLRSVSQHRKENKANDGAQEVTNEGDSRISSDPGVDTPLRSTNKLYSNQQPNIQRSPRSRVGGLGDAKTHLDYTLIPLTRTKGFKKTTDVVSTYKELSRFQPAKRIL
jgi:hypothetical protein